MRRSMSVTILVLVTLFVLPLGLGCGPGGSETNVSGATTSTEAREAWEGSLAGLGDEYFPQAGNGGYDVEHYDITLHCDPDQGGIWGTTVVRATALGHLNEFHLDLVGLQVEGVQLDGRTAQYRRDGQELVVECPATLDAGSRFSVAVTYSGTPSPMTSAEGYRIGWQHAGETILTVDEPEGAATWYPVNDHPSDKATYSFHLTVPVPYVAVANGSLASEEEREGKRTFVWEMAQPMANYLASVVVDELVREETVSPAGIPIRDYFAPAVAKEASVVFARTGEVLDYFSALFGPYPFEVYGVVVPDANTYGLAMENQTISLFGRDTVQKNMAGKSSREMYLSHELAHQWFGNSVTVTEWKDIWLNEGFATYASWLWAEHDRGAEGMDLFVTRAVRALASEGKTLLGDPGAGELFGRTVYQRGALTLHALRYAIGDDRFFAVLRAWVSENSYGNATTQDFIELVEGEAADLAGFDAQHFFDAWLYQKSMPEWPVAAANVR